VSGSNSRSQAVDGPLMTPDGRYLVIRGRLWRATNPGLPEDEKDFWVCQLMAARRALRASASVERRADARALVDHAKRRLGERGPPWWTDGSPDMNRKLVKNTPYGEWFRRLNEEAP
jgi:hypothetical protein